MSNQRIVILGAGLAGLSVAWHLQKAGVACSVFEKEPDVGGLCRSKNINGFIFDYDGHLLHFRKRYAFELVKSLLNKNWNRYKRNAWVYSYGVFTRYPFQANLYGLPDGVAQECREGFIEAQRKNFTQTNGNFLHWIEGRFGGGIAKHFMIPYNTKFWTIPPREMVCDWADGFVPQTKMGHIMGGARGRHAGKLLGYNVNFWYPKKGGIEQLPLAFRKQIRNVYTNCEIERIDLKQKELTFSNGLRTGFDRLVSTIPLPELPKIIKAMPADACRAFAQLRWNSVFNVNLGLKQESRSDKHWIYFPHKEISFFRVGLFHNFSADLVPQGCGSMYVEVSYSKRKPLDKSDIIRRIQRDLRKVGLVKPGDKIIAMDVNDIKYGYPVYDRNYAGAREYALRFLSRHNILPCGRYGSWRYMSMEDVIMAGQETAQQLV